MPEMIVSQWVVLPTALRRGLVVLAPPCASRAADVPASLRCTLSGAPGVGVVPPPERSEVVAALPAALCSARTSVPLAPCGPAAGRLAAVAPSARAAAPAGSRGLWRRPSA